MAASWWLLIGFEQFKKINSHFADFEQVKKKKKKEEDYIL